MSHNIFKPAYVAKYETPLANNSSLYCMGYALAAFWSVEKVTVYEIPSSFQAQSAEKSLELIYNRLSTRADVWGSGSNLIEVLLKLVKPPEKNSLYRSTHGIDIATSGDHGSCIDSHIATHKPSRRSILYPPLVPCIPVRR